MLDGARGAVDAMARGAVLFAGIGVLVGGIAGTLDRPAVGTVLLAVPAALGGALVGAVVGIVLLPLTVWRRSTWAARIGSGSVAAVAIVVATRFDGDTGLPGGARGLLVALAIAMAAAVGPIVAFGAAPAKRAGPLSSPPRQWRDERCGHA